MAVTGRFVVLAAAGLIPVALLPGFGAALGWLGVMLLAVLVDLALAGSPKRLVVERDPVPAVRLGEAVDAPYVVTNGGRRRVVGVVRDAWQPSAGVVGRSQPIDVPAGDRRRLGTRLVPTRRGDRTVQRLVIRSFGPLRVAGRQRSLEAGGTVRVLPAFHSRRHLPSKLARLRELDGRASVQVRGQGTEFDSLRDYVAGDDVRSIDWRATARRQSVVVRTWRPERDRRVLLVLDTARTSAARVGDEPRLDAAMDAALLLAALASRAGDRVDLLALDRRVRARVEGASRTELLPRMVEALAPIEANLVEADWDLISSTVLSRARRRSLVVLLTPLDAAAVEEGLLPVVPALARRHLVLVASVADPRVAEMAAARGDSYAVYGAAAAERARLDRAATVAELSRLGAEVVDAEPRVLAPQLADRYLALKAAGRL
ncbi:DUF58 domain-containing protein [Spongisporangium articulatum]|uniref:DUF58 domain-containing protein n=1 Tax=Spongisporangium articulatum TaxID=3362603 RepID=A0ABW8AJX2_9ACTN